MPLQRESCVGAKNQAPVMLRHAKGAMNCAPTIWMRTGTMNRAPATQEHSQECLHYVYCMRYCTTTLASAGLVVQPAAAVCTATVKDAPAA